MSFLNPHFKVLHNTHTNNLIIIIINYLCNKKNTHKSINFVICVYYLKIILIYFTFINVCDIISSSNYFERLRYERVFSLFFR